MENGIIEHIMNRFYWLIRYVKPIGKFAAIIVFLTFIHWSLVTLYISWCYDSSFYGIIRNIFTISSPICTSINKLQVFLSENFVGFFVNSVIGLNGSIKSLIGI